MRKLPAVLAATIVGGCSLLTARGTPPAHQITSAKPIEQAIACLIPAMNAVEGLTHAAAIIEPGRVFEIAPQQTITVGAEIYFVRVSTGSARATEVELFATGVYRSTMSPALDRCR